MGKLDSVPTMSIGVSAKLLDISTASIRQYEREGLLCLYREDNGRRLLSSKDLERISCVKARLNDQGLNFIGLRKLLALLPCWEMKPCTEEERESCEAYSNFNTPCWAIKGNTCEKNGEDCRDCRVYWEAPDCTENMKEFLKHQKY